MLIDYTLFLGCSYLLYKGVEWLDPGDIICNKLKENNPSCLTLGYRRICGIKTPIVVDMSVTPHLLISGLSNNGKTKCVEYAVKNKKNVVILNAFSEDFKTVKCRRIIGNDKILSFLNNILENPYKREEPLYIVIDELLVLCSDKKISKAIYDLLAIARHFQVYLIGVTQVSAKESVPFKQLFNARCSFRQVDPSCYATAIGCNVDVRLQKREFILYSTEIVKGRTYTI